MRKLLKLFLIISICLMPVMQVSAKQIPMVSKFDRIIKESPVSENATVAVSIKEVTSGRVVYETNQNKLLHPASTLKLFTTTASINTLGQDYNFKTQFFVDKSNNLYIKLGADPMLTSADLKYAVKSLKSQGFKAFNNIYIDDSIVDNVEWGIGWMWDDGVNPCMQKFSAYNLDDNILKINVSLSADGQMVEAKTVFEYPLAIMNTLKPGSVTDIKVNRYNWLSPDIVELKGTVSTPAVVNLPLNNIRRYFTFRLSDYLNSYHIKYADNNFPSALVPYDATMVTEVCHSLNSVMPLILRDSNNKAAESLFKVAASRYSNATGTAEAEAKMFNDFYNNNKIDTKSIWVVDGSGVSRNNLISVDWMTDALDKIYTLNYFNYIKDNMAKSGDGTLKDRFIDLRGNVWLKTGTMSNISGLTGYVIAKNNKIYSVAILTQNFTNPQVDVKALENQILYSLYNLKDYTLKDLKDLKD